MVHLVKGNLLNADVEALVNTVNCVGYMGKGIALQFKKAFPENFVCYANACKRDEVRPGKMLVFETRQMVNPRYIINFPTKRHWKGNSKYEDVTVGLAALIEEVCARGIRKLAIPPLGCGLGGLDWTRIRPMIERAFAALPDVEVLLFEPAGAPTAEAMPVRTKKPHLTPARAMFIKLMTQYRELEYRLTLLEIQKLAYFLQVAGERLRLNYKAGLYGPYAHNLNMVLEQLEGHFIRGYGDNQKPDAEIWLLDDAAEAADVVLQTHTESLSRMDRVARLIEGFETPYGMELLSSVHWVATQSEEHATNADEAVRKVHSWNERKARMLRESHIRIAWARLEKEKWLVMKNASCTSFS